jgi:hypothetical protein
MTGDEVGALYNMRGPDLNDCVGGYPSRDG